MLFAIALGGAPPSGDEGNGDAAACASAVSPVVGSMIGGVGPIPLDVQLFTILPNVQETAPFSIEVHKLFPLPKVTDEAIRKSVKVTDAQAAPEKKPAVVRHVVKSGETLWDIAKAHGVDVDTVLACNNLSNANKLKIGQELKVLTVKGVLHTVRQGESLWDIAKSYKVDVGKIIQANSLANPERLQPKQELVVPGAKPKAAVARSQSGSTAQKSRALVVKGRLQRSFEWPVRGRISSRFGPRWGRMHEGLDIAVNTGTPVRAAAPGKVTFVGWSGNYGYLVKVDHGNGVETRYAHNSRLLAKVGNRVTAGQVLARSGNTGRSTGPHVHFEIRLNGRAYNPLDYLR
jgi:murein DD-endopeptidase MepM/ murein hydrolase activator NlpD